MTRKREPRVPKATCCSLALTSWRGGPVSSCEHLHTVCTGNSDYFDDLFGLLTRPHGQEQRFTDPARDVIHLFSWGACWRRRCRQGQKKKKKPSPGVKKRSEQSPDPDDGDVLGHSPKRCLANIYVKLRNLRRDVGQRRGPGASSKTSAVPEEAECFLVMCLCAEHKTQSCPRSV